ncbi:cell division protein ZapA [Oceanisphaera arctica]|jgi:cell division protein ZapA|uniref:Cell division protein ZapA n=1 Tax=Oceanisphaera arctica TaxID=641510 RepID=A0A2P5TLI7_9GAMM|nr:cell division protein ZapA [Oceanisphaera arctica]PPL16205.1 cell division protein ZapA [Oceanisphaera arctica]GHA11419.1 cell division protein ZapA [Oceanisphaera arctica]
MTTAAIDIVILGRPYKVACPVGQEAALQRASDMLNERIHKFKQGGKAGSNEQIAIMLALNVCHELELEKDKNYQYADAMDKRIKMLQHTIEDALASKVG